MIEFLSSLPYKTYAGLFVCSLFASSWLTPRASWLARGLGLFSISRHTGATHTLGGLAIGIPFIVGISLLLLLKNQVSENMYMVPLHMRGLFFGSCLALGLGLAHDILRLNKYFLIFLQTLLAITAYYYGFHLDVFPHNAHIFFTIGNIAITVVWIGGFIHFFDFYNRHHATFTPFALLSTSLLLVAAFFLDHYRTTVICCLLSGSLLGFMSCDKPLRPNLGSAGTFTLGFTLAVTTLQSQLADGFYGPLALALVAGLFSLIISFTKPIRPLHFSRQENNLRLRSLDHFRHALALEMELAEDEDDIWDLLCRGAEAFDYYGLRQYSTTGVDLKTWGQTTSALSRSLPLHHSGGYIHILIPREDTPASQAIFAALVEVYDRIRGRYILADLQTRKNNLRVVLVNRFYSGTSATGQIIEELAEDLRQMGAAVSVITGSLNYENAELLPGKNEMLNGVHIYRLPATYFGRSSALNRIMDFVFFYLFSIFWIVKTPAKRYTHIIAFTDPPLIALSGYVAQRLKKWKFIYNIQDLYPDTALALNAMEEGLLYQFCSRFNLLLLRRADAIIAISNKIAIRISQLAGPQKRIDIIPNWADQEKVKPIDKSHSELRQELKLKDVFTLVYAGNMGLAQEVDALIKVIRAFEDSTKIQFIFIGGGVRKIDIAAAAQRNSNIHLVEYQDKESLCRYLSLADLGIVTLAQTMEGLAIPTRTYTYLAAGLPILSIADKDSELRIFSTQGLGAHFAPDDIDKIVDYLKQQIEQGHIDRRQEIRAHFIAHFERRLQTGKYWKLLEEI